MLNLKELYKNIERVYEDYRESVLEYRQAGDKVARKEHEIDVEKARLYDEGLINGRNAEVRESQVMLHLNVEFEELDVLKELEAEAKRKMEYVSYEVEMLRALLRVEEVAASTGERLRDENDE